MNVTVAYRYMHVQLNQDFTYNSHITDESFDGCAGLRIRKEDIKWE